MATNNLNGFNMSDFIKQLSAPTDISKYNIGLDANNKLSVLNNQTDPNTFDINTLLSGGPDKLKDQGFWGANGFDMKDASSVIKGLGGLASIYQGQQASQLAQDTFNFNKQASILDSNNQARLINGQLGDRQIQRFNAQAADGRTGVLNRQQYLDANGIKGLTA